MGSSGLRRQFPMNTISMRTTSTSTARSHGRHREEKPIGVIDPETRGVLSSHRDPQGHAVRARRPRSRASSTTRPRVSPNATARSLTVHGPANPPTSPSTTTGAGGRPGSSAATTSWLDRAIRANGIDHDARTMLLLRRHRQRPGHGDSKMVGVRIPQYADLPTSDADRRQPRTATAHYRLTIPGRPARQGAARSVVDLRPPGPASELQTGQPFPSRNSARDGLVANARTGPSSSTSAPSRPRRRATTQNWIQTVPGKGWCAVPAPLRAPRSLVRPDLEAR